MAVIRNVANLLEYLKKIFEGQNAETVYPWLRERYFRRNFEFFPQESEGLIVEYLELFEQVIKIYGKENKVERIGRLEDMFLTFLVSCKRLLFCIVQNKSPYDQAIDDLAQETVLTQYCTHRNTKYR